MPRRLSRERFAILVLALLSLGGAWWYRSLRGQPMDRMEVAARDLPPLPRWFVGWAGPEKIVLQSREVPDVFYTRDLRTGDEHMLTAANDRILARRWFRGPADSIVSPDGRWLLFWNLVTRKTSFWWAVSTDDGRIRTWPADKNELGARPPCAWLPDSSGFISSPLSINDPRTFLRYRLDRPGEFTRVRTARQEPMYLDHIVTLRDGMTTAIDERTAIRILTFRRGDPIWTCRETGFTVCDNRPKVTVTARGDYLQDVVQWCRVNPSGDAVAYEVFRAPQVPAWVPSLDRFAPAMPYQASNAQYEIWVSDLRGLRRQLLGRYTAGKDAASPAEKPEFLGWTPDGRLAFYRQGTMYTLAVR